MEAGAVVEKQEMQWQTKQQGLRNCERVGARCTRVLSADSKTGMDGGCTRRKSRYDSGMLKFAKAKAGV